MAHRPYEGIECFAKEERRVMYELFNRSGIDSIVLHDLSAESMQGRELVARFAQGTSIAVIRHGTDSSLERQCYLGLVSALGYADVASTISAQSPSPRKQSPARMTSL